MYKQVKKPKETKSNVAEQKRSGFQYSDNRQDAIAQRKLQEIIDNRNPVSQLKSTHPEQCNCAGCSGAIQLKKTMVETSIGSSSENPLQLETIQLVCKECNRKSGHRSDCSRHKNNQRAKSEKKKVVHQENQSILNLCSYDSAWVKKNGITDRMILDFVSSYGKINGHASSRSDKDAKRHENTSKDIDAFHSWFGQNGHNY